MNDTSKCPACGSEIRYGEALKYGAAHQRPDRAMCPRCEAWLVHTVDVYPRRSNGWYWTVSKEA